MFKQSIYGLITTCLLCCLFTFSSLTFSSVKADEQIAVSPLAELEQMNAASDENIQRLQTIILTTNGEVKTLANLKLAYLFWTRGSGEKAEAIFEALLPHVDSWGKELQIRFYLYQAGFENSRNRYFDAEQIIKDNALPLAEPDSPQLAKVYKELALKFRYQFKMAKAKFYFEKSLEQYRKQDDPLEVARVYGSLGVLMVGQDRLAEALGYQHKAREAFEIHGNKADKATNLYNLGELYEKTADLDAAYNYYKAALALDIELNNNTDIAFDYDAIASIEMKKQLFPQALEHIELAINLLIKQDAPQMLARSYLRQSKIFKALDDQPKRLQSLKLAEKAGIRAESEITVQGINYNFGLYFFDQGDYDKSIAHLHRALAVATELSLSNYQYMDNHLLAQNYEKQGRFAMAYQHLKNAFEINQELTDKARIQNEEKFKRDINILEQELKVSQLEQQHAQQDQQIKVQRINNQRIVFTSLIVVGILLIAALFLYQRRRLALLESRLHQQTIEQKDRFFSDFSHELRTPLTALKLQVDALKNNLIVDVHASYEQIGRKVMDLNHLITDIYELSKADSGTLVLNITQCHPSLLFEQWDEDLAAYVQGKGLDYQSHFDFDESDVCLDEIRIKQVLFNLIANSCCYTNNPGTIKLSAFAKQSELTVVIEDTPPAVEQHELDKIFSRLYRVEKSRNRQTGGSGLGLSICKSLIEAHGGVISAEQSTLGGLMIRFTINIDAKRA